MDKDTLLVQLEELAEKLGIELRYENIEDGFPFSPGGLCRLEDRYVLFVNKVIRKEDKIRMLGEAVVRFDLGSVYIRPGLREFLSGLNAHISFHDE